MVVVQRLSIGVGDGGGLVSVVSVVWGSIVMIGVEDSPHDTLKLKQEDQKPVCEPETIGESSMLRLKHIAVWLCCASSTPGILFSSLSLSVALDRISLALDLISSSLLSLKRVVHGITLKFQNIENVWENEVKKTNIATSMFWDELGLFRYILMIPFLCFDLLCNVRDQENPPSASMFHE